MATTLAEVIKDLRGMSISGVTVRDSQPKQSPPSGALPLLWPKLAGLDGEGATFGGGMTGSEWTVYLTAIVQPASQGPATDSDEAFNATIEAIDRIHAGFVALDKAVAYRMSWRIRANVQVTIAGVAYWGLVIEVRAEEVAS
jgi:hypothetical protein